MNAIHELRSCYQPPSGTYEVIYFLGILITPEKMLKKWKKKNVVHQDIRRIVLSKPKEIINCMLNFSYKDIMKIPLDVINSIQYASLNEDYMNENMMMMKSLAVTIFVKFLNLILQIRQEISENCTLRKFVELECLYDDIRRRKEKSNAAMNTMRFKNYKKVKESITTGIETQTNGNMKSLYQIHQERSQSAPIGVDTTSISSLPYSRNDVSNHLMYPISTTSSTVIGRNKKTFKVKGAAKWSRMMKGLSAYKSTR